MALRKEFSLPTGVVAEYVKVRNLVVRRPELKLDVVAALHLDQDNSESDPVQVFAIKPFDITLEQSEQNLVALAYALLKTDAEFEDAEDC